MNLRGFTNGALLSDVRELIGSQRELTARLVVYLAEIEYRGLHVVAGYSSMFEFCVKELRLSEGEAFRRLAAARLSRQFPIIPNLIASGEVHLSALALLRTHLTRNNHAELLEAIRGKSNREVEMLVAARFPCRDEPARIRPLTPERHRIEFTASTELREKLERCLDLSSHANPSRDLAFVIERAVDLLATKLERDHLGKSQRPRPRAPIARTKVKSSRDEPPRESPASHHIATATRRLVFERDGSRCCYVSPAGRHCAATAFLEIDHIVPRGKGGGDEPENLRVRCRAHNRLWAEQAFGRHHVERAVHLRQRKYAAKPDVGSDTPSSSNGERCLDSSCDVHEKVILALTRLGFRPAQARRAVTAAEKRQGTERSLTLEGLLRDAVLEATRAA